MESEVKKRKKRFWAFCLALVLALLQVSPPVYATSYSVGYDSSGTYLYYDERNQLKAGDIIKPGDIISYKYNTYYSLDANFTYKDAGGVDLHADPLTKGTETYQYTIREYDGSYLTTGTFKGWKINEISGTGSELQYITFTAVAYTERSITYNNTEGATNPNPTTYYEGKEKISLADASKEGYTFAGWYEDESFDESKKIESISTDRTGDITLFAKFLKHSNITYKLNGTVVETGNPSYYVEGRGTEGFSAPNVTGYDNYDFAGWYDNPSFTGTAVEKIGAGTTGNITLYAKFTPKKYNISYVVDSETTNPTSNPTSYTYGTGVTSFADARKQGYTFDGWYKDGDSAGTKVEKISTTDAGDITLSAKFTANTYGISYVLNGGTNPSTNPTTYTYGEGVESFAKATKEGYSFGGWYSDAGFTNEVTFISTTQTEDLILYAKFLVNDYSITYNLNGGTNGEGNPSGYVYGMGVDSLEEATKTGYTFDGWYSDAAFTTNVDSIPATQSGDVNLYAKFVANTYGITYELNGGTNGAGNPESYSYGTGVTSFADAVKNGYSFDGWYSDEKFTTKVISIPATQMGEVKLYAKYTKIIKEGAGTVTVDDVYYGEAITPVFASETNGISHVTIEYKKKGAADSTYTQKAPVKAGEYTVRATFAKTDDYYEVIATDDFAILKKEGEGSISVADVYYGKLPNPVIESVTNGTKHVTIEYKEKDASDDKYTYTKPKKAGEYTARAVFAETEGYLKVTATDNFSIDYLDAPESPYKIKGTMGENNYYTSVVTILPAKGYIIADSQDGTYKNTLELTKTTDSFFIYLKDTKTGEKTSGIEVPGIKIDKDAPAILNTVSGETIYAEKTEIIIKDDHLKQVSVNDREVEFKNGTAVLQLASNQGEEQYDIVGVDDAGNRSKIHITVAAEWMKSKVIPSGVKVRLYKKYSYQLGSGNWKVDGDSTTYAGNATFYVNSDGDYSFSNAN